MSSLMASRPPTDRDGPLLNAAAATALLQPLDPMARLRWGLQTFGDSFALTTSFGIQSAVLLHMVSRISAAIPVIWVDTGYLPAETYRYAETLCQLLKLNLQVAQPEQSSARMEALHGRLWETGRLEDMDLYLRMRKVEPLDRMFEQLQVHGWASGVRGNQTDHRRAMRPLDSVRGRWSLRPLLSWTSRDVFYYMQDQALPHHPLFEQGYSTVGDWHSSGPDAGSDPGEDGQREDGQRGSRFAGLRQECGIHLPGVMGEGI
ncbi:MULTISPECIES: phosphoadenylyl-sulfate reductase [Synechococcaceae]|uniref:phosphoadenylyl-sulfate reductase n=1 Tax=Synechococcaceae TaxID=1890426 RepID=UPI0008FF714C|nr:MULTISPECIES: phosphoadenylyl-sulfate reductase [Synechococcaceae]APD49486.1 phosphoadenosine phosphosulfate reductase [Synechococcus sp. SynAce01]MCT4363898.1 phosphoadenylyl-sulfate reductase [Candidatus Regnicoccus frigidus MAG-AL1]MCT4367684.1 phosphoadenylyl-sulfate reductase [Candidatus Regnicoccus frigidus MAG-AL2]